MTEIYRHTIYDRVPTLDQVRVFGQERMERVAGNEAAPERVAELLNGIEVICSDVWAEPHDAADSGISDIKRRSIYMRSGENHGEVPLVFRMNPRRVRLQGYTEMHNTLGSINWLKREPVKLPRKLFVFLPKIERMAREGIFITEVSGQLVAMIQREIYSPSGRGRSLIENKVATAAEVDETWDIITGALHRDDTLIGRKFRLGEA